MKFKEQLDLKDVIYQDDITKLFDTNTVQVCKNLEKTIQDFWNVDRPSANFLNMMIKIKKAKNVLEIGTSNGYSGIWLARALLDTKGKLTTIEFWQKRIDLALENFKKAGVADIITTIVGDAIEILEKMHKEKTQKFDFIFVDANKAEYIEYFKYFDDLLDVGGIIVADNILSHYKKTKNYVETLINHPKYRSQILNFEAGMMLSYKVQP